MTKNAITWIREDFRIEHNPALAYATQNHENVAALYIYNKADFDNKREAQKWWVCKSLINFKNELIKYNIELELVFSDEITFSEVTIALAIFAWDCCHEATPGCTQSHETPRQVNLQTATKHLLWPAKRNGEEAKEGWEANPELVPDGSIVMVKIKTDIKEQKKTEGVSDGQKLFKFIIAGMAMHSGIVAFFP